MWMMSYLRPVSRSGGFASLDGVCAKPEDTFVEIVKRLACCQTQNQFNRVHIDLENILAPLELANFAIRGNPRSPPSRPEIGCESSKHRFLKFSSRRSNSDGAQWDR